MEKQNEIVIPAPAPVQKAPTASKPQAPAAVPHTPAYEAPLPACKPMKQKPLACKTPVWQSPSVTPAPMPAPAMSPMMMAPAMVMASVPAFQAPMTAAGYGCRAPLSANTLLVLFILLVIVSRLTREREETKCRKKC